MEAQSHLSEPSENIPEPSSVTGLSFAWLDIAYGILVAPGQTLEVLGNTSVYKTGSRAFVNSLITFVASAMISNLAKITLEPNHQFFVPFLLIAFMASLLSWISLAVFLQFLCGLYKRTVNWLSIFVVTGWAFLPLIFTAPISCLVLANSVCRILLIGPLIWFIYLQLLAFDSLLRLGKARTLALFIVMPPVVFFACLFWFTTLLMMFIGIYLPAIG